MVEYLYDAIRATAGTDISISAQVIDTTGNPVTEDCDFIFYMSDSSILTIGGIYTDNAWVFTIPAEYTENLKGRYWYCVKHDDEHLCFKQPIYLV